MITEEHAKVQFGVNPAWRIGYFLSVGNVTYIVGNPVMKRMLSYVQNQTKPQGIHTCTSNLSNQIYNKQNISGIHCWYGQHLPPPGTEPPLTKEILNIFLLSVSVCVSYALSSVSDNFLRD